MALYSKKGVLIIFQLYINHRNMTFLAQQNRETVQQPNRGFRRDPFGYDDPGKMEKKNLQQQQYKNQLERQMREKEAKKEKEKQLIRREDQRFMREVQEITRKEKAAKEQQTKRSPQPNQHGFNPNYDSPQNIKEQQRIKLTNHPNKLESAKIIPESTSDKQYSAFTNIESKPSYQQYNRAQSQPYYEYHEQRMRRHKQDIDRKLDELFHHIHSTEDHIKVDQQLARIRMRLKAKPKDSREGLRDMTDSGKFNYRENEHNIEEYNKFYRIPKKTSNNLYEAPKQQVKTKKLDYQSSSAFKVKEYQPRIKIHTHIQQQPLEPTKYSSHSHQRPNKWGKKPNNDKFLSDRDALDLQIKRSQESIDNLLRRLGQS